MPNKEKEQKHLAHPIKGLIPWQMWEKEFNGYAREEELNCIMPPIEVIAYSQYRNMNKKKMFLCALIGHGEEHGD